MLGLDYTAKVTRSIYSITSKNTFISSLKKSKSKGNKAMGQLKPYIYIEAFSLNKGD